ncbi:hypothetical protein VNO78_14162 [Psophocarpus tetragonolobus]|uniref:FAS1 domain-containing protein n=1 Tax=Psophocarpus tetragonolobus TaxID=3891 RepID=A0AAN9SR48_PSOTE
MGREGRLVVFEIIIWVLHASSIAAESPASTPQGQAQPREDIVSILTQGNSFNMFLHLMKSTQLINQLNSQLISIKSGGLTILAPDDGAFTELKPGFLNSLSDAKKLELVQFHVLPDLVTTTNFDTITNPVRTLAGNKPGKVQLDVISYGGTVNISTGPVNTTINGLIYTDSHLAVYRVAKVLIPSEFVAPTTKTNITATSTPLPAPSPSSASASASSSASSPAPATHLPKPPTPLPPTVISAAFPFTIPLFLCSLLPLLFLLLAY